MKFEGWPHVVESQQFSRKWLEDDFFKLTRRMERISKSQCTDSLRGKRMISLFYQSSTRTRASFEIAMRLLGGEVIFSTENAREFSSAVKGESLRHTIQVLNRYNPDVIILRYDQEGGARIARDVSGVPVINAGDGAGQHPTQALLDIYTIRKKLGRLDNINVAMIGDLAKGRTVRSLAYLLAKFKDVTIYFVSPDSARMKNDIKDYLGKKGVRFFELDQFQSIAQKIDVWYSTRTQTEHGSEFDRSDLIIDRSVVRLMREDAIIMHPLPIDDRVKEIAPEVEIDPRSVFLNDQVDSGLFTRMALLQTILLG